MLRKESSIMTMYICFNLARARPVSHLIMSRCNSILQNLSMYVLFMVFCNSKQTLTYFWYCNPHTFANSWIILAFEWIKSCSSPYWSRHAVMLLRTSITSTVYHKYLIVGTCTTAIPMIWRNHLMGKTSSKCPETSIFGIRGLLRKFPISGLWSLLAAS